MKNVIKVKKASIEDSEDIYELELRNFDSPWTLSLVENQLFSPLSKYLIMYLGGVPCGYVCISEVMNQGEILSFAIDRDYRGRGLSKILLKAALDEFKEETNEIFLEVRTSNEVAIHLYGKFGFKIISTRENYYENFEDAYVMVRYKDGDR